jgi:hypothetical protein
MMFSHILYIFPFDLEGPSIYFEIPKVVTMCKYVSHATICKNSVYASESVVDTSLFTLGE